jgi:hypothetical protein
MAIKNNSFETIEGIARAAGSAAKQGIADVAKDASESITGNYPSASSGQVLPEQQKIQIKSTDDKKAVAVRQNIAQMNQKQQQFRQQKQQQQNQQVQKQAQVKQEKKFEVQKKESILSKILKSRKGTKEGVNRVGN